MKASMVALALLVGCVGDGEETGDDSGSAFTGCEGTGAAYATFDAFWQTFDREYAVFDLRLPAGKTWGQIGAAACSKLSPTITDVALYDLLLGMARELDDGHTTITADAISRDDDAEVSVYPSYEAVYGLEDLVEEKYLAAEYQRAAEDEISWGTITGGTVGYISITAMEELSPSGDEDDDVAAARAAMQSAMTSLAGSTGIIVDVRANEGGWDTVSLEIAAWFDGPRTVAWSEQVRNGPAHDDLAAPVDTFVDATRTGGFTGPVVVLTSGGTFSAAETFVLAMRVRSNVTILGERTAGHLSDMIEGTLPNGWTFTYSGERYIAADGEVYEVRGLPVDVDLPLDLAAITRSTDPQLEAALARLAR